MTSDTMADKPIMRLDEKERNLILFLRKKKVGKVVVHVEGSKPVRLTDLQESVVL